MKKIVAWLTIAASLTFAIPIAGPQANACCSLRRAEFTGTKGYVGEAKREGKVARRALDWLVVALQPLQLSQIMEGLSIDLGRRVVDCDSGPVHGSALLDALGSLVMYDEVTDIVILSHYSVKVCLMLYRSLVPRS